MADVNLQLVREFFELNLFRVLTNWQQDSARQRAGEPAPQIFVENAAAAAVGHAPAPFVLKGEDVRNIERAVVEVRAWHAERFYPSVIEPNPVLWQFAREENLEFARELFSGRAFTTILVISELPPSPELRTRSISLLEETGIGHVLEFPVILKDVLDKLSESANYASSQTLQTLRLLKRYRFVRHQQMEFPFLREPVISDSEGAQATLPLFETADLLADLDPEQEADV